MIVAILNYHSSIITIMAKNDNILCINHTIKTETVRQNSLQSRLRTGYTHHKAQVRESITFLSRPKQTVFNILTDNQHIEYFFIQKTSHSHVSKL